MHSEDPARRMRVAVLDDYLGSARTSTDWGVLRGHVDVTFFVEHHPDPDEVVAALADFDIIVAMRERTPFPAAVLERLPRLRLLVTTGMRNASIDLAAATERDILVCGTGSNATGTAELTWALIMGLVRNVEADDAHIRDGGWQRAMAATWVVAPSVSSVSAGSGPGPP